jgi:hypothetical protein
MDVQVALMCKNTEGMETTVEYEIATKNQNLLLATCFEFNSHW